MFLPRFLRGAYLSSQGLTLAGAASGGTGLAPALLPPGAGQPRPRAVTPRASSYVSSKYSPALFGLDKQCRAGISSQPGFNL